MTSRQPIRSVVVVMGLLLGIAATSRDVSAQTTLFPAIEPHDSGMLEVSDVHTIYWQVSGSDDGLPLIALHGGPGGASADGVPRLFDPERYRIIQFDQRGSGRSRPFAEWKDNDTDALIADIDAVRTRLGVGDRAVLFGIGWGTTLALAYAEAHPERVAGLLLWGVFTCTQKEVDHIYGGGVLPFYPDVYADLQRVVPEPNTGHYPKQLFDVLTGDDADARRRAITAVVTFESWLENVGSTMEGARDAARDPDAASLAVLETYYFSKGCFLDENELFANADALKNVPVYIVNGRLDLLAPPRTAYRLSRRLRRSRIEIVEGSGHVDIGVALAAVRGAAWLYGQAMR